MKSYLLTTAFAVLLAFTAQAQRFAYVDVNAIMESIPEYKTAQAELDRISEQWKQDIQREYQKIDQMYRKFQAESVLLSDADRKRREEEIVALEKQVRETQKTKFGPEGELFKRRQSLVKPIQDKVYKAISAYAQEKGYDFILDKGSTTMLYASDTFDKTQDVIKRLTN